MALRFPEDEIVSAFSLTSNASFRKMLRSIPNTLQGRSTLPSLSSLVDLQRHDHDEFQQVAEVLSAVGQLALEGKLESLQSIYEELELCYLECLVAEILSKVLVYREGLDGKRLQLPFYREGVLYVEEYVIEEAPIGENLPVMLLASEAEGAPSWIVPRGTSPFVGLRSGAVESIRMDIGDPRGIDLTPVIHARERLHSIATDLSSGGSPLILAGHSLGGAYVVQMAVDLHSFGVRARTFNLPLACDWTKKKHDALEEPPEIVNLLTQGDPIPLVGRHLLGVSYAVEPASYRRQFPGQPLMEHLCMTLNQDHTLQRVDREREERRFSRIFTEQYFRSRIGWFLQKYW